MNHWIAPMSLSGQHVQLVPLSHEHRDDLAEAVRDGDLWNHWYTAIPTPEGMAAEITRRLDLQAKGSMYTSCPCRTPTTTTWSWPCKMVNFGTTGTPPSHGPKP